MGNLRAKYLCFSLGLFASSFVWGAPVALKEKIVSVPQTVSATQTASQLNELRKRLIDQERSVSKMTGSIIQLEKEIGKGNERYLKIIQKRRDVENTLFDIKQTLKKYDQELLTKQQKTNKLLAVAVMSSLDKNEDPAILLSRKLAVESLKNDLQETKLLWTRNQELNAQMEDLKERYEEYLTVETELASVLNNLEAQKKEVQDSYSEELERKNAIKQKVEHLSTVVKNAPKPKENQTPTQAVTKVISSSAPLDVKGVFSAPLKAVLKLEPQTRGGVYLSFKGSQPITATRDGRVMYVGDLSTYGNVVMIEHGEETRSVILGPFSPKVAQGTAVKLGDVIGQTPARPGSGKIYFEVRKKNTVQNTVKLIDEKSMSIKIKG